jgi:hypothetical protein
MSNESATNLQPSRKDKKDTGSPLVPNLPKDEHEEELIDEALTETFPASDPVAIPTPQDKEPPPKKPGRSA